MTRLAEQFSAASAGPRLVEREAERKQRETELQRLELQLGEGKMELPPEFLQDTLTEMRDALTSKNILDQQTLLSQRARRHGYGGHERKADCHPSHIRNDREMQNAPKEPRMHAMSTPLLG